MYLNRTCSYYVAKYLKYVTNMLLNTKYLSNV